MFVWYWRHSFFFLNELQACISKKMKKNSSSSGGGRNKIFYNNKKTYPNSRTNSPAYSQVSGMMNAQNPTQLVDPIKNYASGNEPPPTAPSIDAIEKIAGYENVTFSEAPLKPPSYDDVLSGQPPERQDIGNMPTMNEEQVLEALQHHVSEHCCYGSKPAKQLIIREIRYNSAFHYTLETYGEQRDTAFAFEPYRGQQLDSYLNGPAPDPWQIVVNSPEQFKTCKGQTQVPHTENTKPCHDCTGLGRKRCYMCSGMGHSTCTLCGGSGRSTFSNSSNDHHHHHHHEPCTSCSGTGNRRCFHCSGHGQVTCKTCSGHGQLKFFVRLTINWTNHVEDFISDTANLPKELITQVSGQLAFEEQQPRVWPITHFPDPTVNTASQRIVTRHSTAFSMEKILQQRHRVRIVPVSQVQYSWKTKEGSFYVYGYENKVYFPDYPHRCCWGCNVL